MTDEAETVPVHPFALLGYDVAEAVDIARDAERVAKAYQSVFRTNEGRAVLFDMMARAHMSEMRPANMTDRERAYMDGWAAMAIETLNLAGVDPIERVAALHVYDALPPRMERTHDRPINPDAGHGDADRGSADPDANSF